MRATGFGALSAIFTEIVPITPSSGFATSRRSPTLTIVIENETAGLVGIEVKAAATVNAGDFKGLRKLADATGDALRLGLVLYDGENTVPFGGRMFAAPVSCVWG